MFALLVMVTLAAPPKVDTSKWEKKTLASLGKPDDFSFKAQLKLPAKTKSKTSTYTAGSDKGGVAYVDLPSGVRVILMERAANSMNDPSMTAEMLAMTGKVLEVRKTETSFMIFVQQDQGLVIQGATWAVVPGLSCASEKPLTMAQAEEVTAICNSVSALKP